MVYPPSVTCGAALPSAQDTSTGQLVAEHRTKLGDCRVMRQNPYNACMCLGHGNGTARACTVVVVPWVRQLGECSHPAVVARAPGTVTMWTPNMNQPVVKMLCHRGPGAFTASRIRSRSWLLTRTLTVLCGAIYLHASVCTRCRLGGAVHGDSRHGLAREGVGCAHVQAPPRLLLHQPGAHS